MCYNLAMTMINQRQLRNDSAEVMRRVEQGQTYTVTRRGVPVARLSPITGDAELRCLQPARRRVAYSGMSRVVAARPTEEIVAEIRDER